MIKQGDIFYFVDADLGKITKLKVSEILENGIVQFSNFKSVIHKDVVFLNPAPKDYFCSHSKCYGTKKPYFIFTKAEDAQQALVDYILPQILEVQQNIADNITKKYHKLIDKVEKLEKDLIKNKKDFNKKCNALKSKFV
jgi:hypothetical protein